VSELPPREAVKVAVWAAATVPASGVKVVDVEPAGTVTEVGAVSAELLDVRRTTAPPGGATPLRMIVQVIDAPGETLEGLHARDAAVTGGAVGGTRVRMALAELPVRVAVIVAV